MHSRSMSTEYHLNTPNTMDHRGSFSSTSSSLSLEQPFYTSTVRSQLPPPPPSLNTALKPSHTNTFVHKLYNMVLDRHYQHLIAWAYSGSSFIVCNIMEFSRDVLPKHFKHNNFSSFVRQLNMYGFHKVNKSPRGHRTLAENQIWEFSHPKFLRNQPDMLDEIKRKSMENDNSKREQSDLQSHVSMLKASQSEMIAQIQCLYENFAEVIKELDETKRKQENQLEFMRSMLNFISQQNGGQLPQELEQGLQQFEMSFNSNQEQQQQQEKPPSIFITSHDPNSNNNNNGNTFIQDVLNDNTPLTVHTQNLNCYNNNSSRLSISSYGNNLPPSPSPSMLLSDDELDNTSSLYSPNSPHTPRHYLSTTNYQQHNATYNSCLSPVDSLSHH